jgi:hypothetical protein
MRTEDMEHQDWIDSMATESYTLGELEPAKRDAFEEHFFDCPVCSNDVRDAAKVVAGIRTRDVRAITPAAPRLRWWAAAAVAAVLSGGLIVVQQMGVGPGAMTRLGHPIRLEPASRGVSDTNVFRRDEAIPLIVIIPPEDPQTAYECDVQDLSGHKLASQQVTQADAKDPVPMVIQPGTLKRGMYNLVVRSGDRKIAEYPFTVEVK